MQKRFKKVALRVLKFASFLYQSAEAFQKKVLSQASIQFFGQINSTISVVLKNAISFLEHSQSIPMQYK